MIKLEIIEILFFANVQLSQIRQIYLTKHTHHHQPETVTG